MIWLIENEANGDQTLFSEKVGLNPSEISQIKSAKSQRNIGDKLARKMEVAFNKPKFWLDNQLVDVEQRHPNQNNHLALGGVEVWDNKTPLSNNEVEVKYYMDVELAAGCGMESSSEFEGPVLRFNKNFLSRKGVDPSSAACVKVSGSSMEPRLNSGDVVVIDKARVSVNDGDTYAINHDGLLRIKRLYLLPGGGLRINSFNSAEYQDEILSAEQRQLVIIIGRVFHSISDW